MFHVKILFSVTLCSILKFDLLAPQPLIFVHFGYAAALLAALQRWKPSHMDGALIPELSLSIGICRHLNLIIRLPRLPGVPSKCQLLGQTINFCAEYANGRGVGKILLEISSASLHFDHAS